MIKELGKKYKEYVINLRREFHMNPELGFQEYKTSTRIKEELDKMNIEYKTVVNTGVVATIKGINAKKTIVLRADMDALQVKEMTMKEYSSKNEGIMHACGHDGHTAMLLGAAKILSEIKNEINGTIKLYFQPSEENATGALKMLREEPLIGVDGCFAIHVWSDLESGKVSVESGPRMASADIFKIIVEGKGGHGSLPHQTIDSVVVGSSIVMNLQSIISREITPLEPAVLTVGKFISGTRFNIIANSAILEGTTRTFSPEIQKNFKQIIERVTKSTAEAYRARVSVEYNCGTKPVINDERCSLIAKKSVEKILGKEGISLFEKITGGEDFCYFLESVPGILAFVGARNEKKGITYPHHHEKFDIDEDCLEIGTVLYAQYAIDFLNNIEDI